MVLEPEPALLVQSSHTDLEIASLKEQLKIANERSQRFEDIAASLKDQLSKQQEATLKADKDLRSLEAEVDKLKKTLALLPPPIPPHMLYPPPYMFQMMQPPTSGTPSGSAQQPQMMPHPMMFQPYMPMAPEAASSIFERLSVSQDSIKSQPEI
jgi:hypothetical protein